MSIYNIGMNSLNSESPSESMASLHEGMNRVSAKLERLQEELAAIQIQRSEMENKIVDAQSRIHKILNRLPKTEDTRQMNLLNGSGDSSEDNA